MRVALAICAVFLFAGFAALGTWQVQRLHWKNALIARVEQRVHAPAVAAPGQQQWPRITAESDEYRHVSLTGTFLFSLTVKVQASTELGSGVWLLTPLRLADGSVVLVNRGFVSVTTGKETHPDASTVSTVTGLLRMPEPGGGFLRHNDPVTDHWYSRDVQGIAVSRHLSLVAPYFVDADAAQESSDIAGSSAERPVGGLTVIAFHNNHLVYAITWYVLACMVAGAYWRFLREGRKQD